MTIKTITSVGLALILTALATSATEARTQAPTPEYDRHSISGAYYYGVQPQPTYRSKRPRRVEQARHRVKVERARIARHGAQPAAAGYAAVMESGGAPQVVEHPAGCPRSRFCGCGTSLYLLGKAVSRGGLAIASNWLGFPGAEAAPGMAAARPGHVFAIVKVIAPGVVLAYDPNSGRRQTRVHVRSLRGYTVVNPHGANRYASAG